ncbi:hypothetical protein OSTOST_13217, partial [Ostertagia ostertagi]
MWLIVCTTDRQYAVVNEKNVVRGNVSCGSRVTVHMGDVKRDVTVIFIGRNRAQCDQYCQRLSRYCGPAVTKEKPVDIAFLGLPKKRRISGAEAQLNAASRRRKPYVKEVPSAAISSEHEDVTPSTSSERDHGKKQNGDVGFIVPQSFFAELLRSLKNLRGECRSRFDRLDDQLDDLAGRVSAVEEIIQEGNAFFLKVDNSSPSSSHPQHAGDTGINTLLGSPLNGQTSKLQYPYPLLSETDVIMLQKESKTITSFARKVDRVLFANDSDKDSPIDARADKE